MKIKNVRAVYFPYCIEKQKDGSWVVLNRDYNPVGFNTSERITYEDYPVSMKIKGLGPGTLRKLSWNDEEPGDKVYLYNDSCTPTRSEKAMFSYFEKLKILLKLKGSY